MPKIEKNKHKKSKFKIFVKFSTEKLKKIIDRLDVKLAIKVTLAAILSLYVCVELDSLFKHPDYLISGLWCVVAAIVVLQSSLGGTYKAIWNRFLGVLIGSALGAFFAFEFGAEPIMIGLAIFMTILFCSLLRIEESYRIASLSVVIIMVPWKLHPTSDPWVSGFARFIDTCVGFIIAILVSHIFWPSRALTKMRLNMADALNLFRQFFEHLLIPAENLHKSHKISQSLLNEIDQVFSQSRQVLEESKIELLMRFAPVGVWIDMINCQERLWESLRVLQNVMNSTLEEIFDEEMKQQIRHAVEVVDFALKELALKLKTGKTSFNFDILNHLQHALQKELVRFRSTHTMKRYNLDVVENYFVFFYQLKQILKTLYQFNQLLDHIELRKKMPALED
jgi:hypothetical protein